MAAWPEKGQQVGVAASNTHYSTVALDRTAYVYKGCLAWYNVVLTQRIRSSVMKYSQRDQHL